ncbi:MAG TPA: DUF2231 domain-containing protein [Terriglobales bacterium]
MANPFDPRSVLLAKHAQHVVLIHFPVALFITGVAFDLLSRGKRSSQWSAAAYLNLTTAAITVFPAIVTGVLAWQFVLEGKRLKGLLLYHLIAASCTALLLLVTWVLHWRVRRTEHPILPAYRLPVELLGVAAVALTAHLGGFLSGINS